MLSAQCWEPGSEGGGESEQDTAEQEPGLKVIGRSLAGRWCETEQPLHEAGTAAQEEEDAGGPGDSGREADDALGWARCDEQRGGSDGGDHAQGRDDTVVDPERGAGKGRVSLRAGSEKGTAAGEPVGVQEREHARPRSAQRGREPGEHNAQGNGGAGQV